MYLVISNAASQTKVHLNFLDTLEESGKYLSYVGSKGGKNYVTCLEAIC